MTWTSIVVGVIPTSVDWSVTLAHWLGAVVDAAGAAAAVVVLDFELLREQLAAITQRTTNPDSATDFLTKPPVPRN
jgi:hypothetical protein